jgi:hypothetical protein
MTDQEQSARLNDQHELHRLVGAAINDSTYASLELQRLAAALADGKVPLARMDGKPLGRQLLIARKALEQCRPEPPLPEQLVRAIDVGLDAVDELKDYRNRLAHDRWKAEGQAGDHSVVNSYHLSTSFDPRVTTTTWSLSHLATMFFQVAVYLRAVTDVTLLEYAHPGQGISIFSSENKISLDQLAVRLPGEIDRPKSSPSWRWEDQGIQDDAAAPHNE